MWPLTCKYRIADIKTKIINKFDDTVIEWIKRYQVEKTSIIVLFVQFQLLSANISYKLLLLTVLT